ncbi:MAG: hypothetical protein RBG13Loki_0237 [Promethearchaeota archaeon CR_4]|nr:MAG: hypothetical protein RBG13Loki_0237 [Candidatus Lokiarchaeota archaeon CR_4]
MKRVGIIGAGSAGLFAAYELGSANKDLEITIFEQGRDVPQRKCTSTEFYCRQCQPCNIMAGVGGAGVYSSGILNLNPNIGGDLAHLAGSEVLAQEIINYIDKIFLEHGAPQTLFVPENGEHKVDHLIRKAASVDITYIPVVQRLLGSENSPAVITALKKTLEKKLGVKFRLETQVTDITRDLVLTTTPRAETFPFDFILIASGRVGMEWLEGVCESLKIKTFHGPIDIGVRVEVPSILFNNICSIQRDPKFHIYSNKYNDFMRTFCVNHEGFVVREMYDDNRAGVNGISYLTKKSKNTNFAFLTQMNLTAPLEDSTLYGRLIAKQTTILGGGNPLVQTLGDLRRGHRSTPSHIQQNPVQGTLKSATPGDIAMAYPGRILDDISDGLLRLEKVIPGIANNSTLLYAPEVKFAAKKIDVKKNLESAQVPNLFVAGDGAGLSRGIIGAAVTGILAARGILANL